MSKIRTAALLLVLLPGLARAGDMLPLQHGYYLPAGIPCRMAEKDTILRYDGKSFSDARLRCLITRVAPMARNWRRVDEACRDLQVLPGFGGERHLIGYFDVVSSIEFIEKTGTREFRGVFCPEESLPSPWREDDPATAGSP